MGSLRAVRLVKFETSGIYFTYKFMLLFVYTTTQKMFCNFHIQVFQIKLKYHRCKLIKLQQLLNSLVKGLRKKMTPALITFSSVRKGHAFPFSFGLLHWTQSKLQTLLFVDRTLAE